MIGQLNFVGYLPKCTPAKGNPWFAGNVPVGYTAQDCRVEFTERCTGKKYSPEDWDGLKKEGWRIVKVSITDYQ